MCLRRRVENIGGMSDLCLYELEDNIWDEFGESDDHMVPQPNSKLGGQYSAESIGHRKLQSEVIGITSDADSSTKYRVQGKVKREIQPVTGAGTMLEKGPWSHTPGGVFPSCDTESTKGVPSIASDDTRVCSHSLKNGNVDSDSCEFCADDSIMVNGCAADDNALYRYPLGQLSQSDNDLTFLDNQQEDKDNGDLLYYGWPDIGNFEDVDRMFRSCDSTFGMQSLNNDEDLCWFPSNATGQTEDASKSGLSISGQKEGSSTEASDHNEALWSGNEGHQIHASNKKSVCAGNKMSSQRKDYDDTVALGQTSCLNEVGTKSENRDILLPKEQTIFCKKQPKHHNQVEEERTDQYLENGSSFHHYDYLNQISDTKLPQGDLPSQVYSTPDTQQHEQSAVPDSMSFAQSQYLQLDYSNHLDQISVFPTPSGTKSENNGCPSPSLKESSYASNQSQSMESSHGLSIEIPALKMSEKGENQQSIQGLQSPFARNFDNATTTNTMVFCGTANQKQVQHAKNHIAGQKDVKGGNIELPIEWDSSNVQESSCMSTMMDDISLEATSFRQLQQVMEKLDVRTKLCIRDSLYRLARSAEQRHNCANQRGIRENGDTSRASIVEETNKCTGFMDIETDTNPIDRSIAHLLFHRPSDPSRVPTNDSLLLRSHMMVHESVSSPQGLAEKQACHEETVAGGEKETLITDDA